MSNGFGGIEPGWVERDEEYLNKLIYQSEPGCDFFTIDRSYHLGFTTYHTFSECPKNLDCCDVSDIDFTFGWATNLELEDMVCDECEGRCSKSYDGCTIDMRYREEIDGEIIDYCTNCWDKEGTFLIKECRKCDTKGELVGLRPTIVTPSDDIEDATDLCSDCYMKQVTLYARERENMRVFLHKCIVCEELFKMKSLIKIPFCEHLDKLSIVNSTISNSKYCCIDCLEEEDYQDDYSDLFAVDSIVSPREIKIHFGSLYELLIEDDDFRIYKMKESHN
jgi:hypothetical protein